jgi:recombination protein RecA
MKGIKMAKSKSKAGKISIDGLRSLINKTSGVECAHNLNQANPTEVKEWIPTGSRWLDSIICRGQLAGIPVGKFTEIAGLEATGKSFMAAQIAANAQKMGMNVVYMDSESAIDPGFLERTGCDLENLIYVQAQNVEHVLETVEAVLDSGAERTLFIWDSLALTPTVSDVEGDFNPNSTMAVKARVLSKGMSKLTVPIANTQSAFLVLNQLKTNIPQGPNARIIAMTTPYITPGGKSMHYVYSLRIWLTGRKAKAAFIVDDSGFRIGSEVKVKLEKSRFGTAGRNCAFKILWGSEDIGVQDKESWLEAIKISDNLKQAGAWYSLVYSDGTEEKFQSAHWLDKLEDDKFRNRVFEIMDEEIIKKFDNREGDAGDFYDVDKEE